MFALIDSNVYIQSGDYFIRVEIYPDKILKTNEKIKYSDFDILYTLDEIKLKYSNKYPIGVVEPKVEIKDEPQVEIKEVKKEIKEIKEEPKTIKKVASKSKSKK